jgi:hypothetical protein
MAAGSPSRLATWCCAERARTTGEVLGPRPRREILSWLRPGIPLGGWRGAGDAGASAEGERLRRALGADGPRRVPGLAPNCRTRASGAGPAAKSRSSTTTSTVRTGRWGSRRRIHLPGWPSSERTRRAGCADVTCSAVWFTSTTELHERHLRTLHGAVSSESRKGRAPVARLPVWRRRRETATTLRPRHP